jgi:hypothetical protein
MPRYCYKVIKTNITDGQNQRCTFYKNQAIIAASNDLPLCYTNALTEGLKYFPNSSEENNDSKKNKSIAFPTLSADVGFPRDKAVPITLTSITNFIRNYISDGYDRIELVVKKRSEFAAYKKFLINYWQKPCLLILAHQDNKHFLYTIPRELLDFILRLMHPVTHYQ